MPTQIRWTQWISAATLAVYLAAVYSQRPLFEWITGALAGSASVLVLVVASTAGCSTRCGVLGLHIGSGALMLGAVTHGMVLGHWYLNQARLPTDPLKQATRIIFGALAIATVVGIATRATVVSAKVSGGLVALSGSAYWLAWLLMVAGTAVLAVMVMATVKVKSTQSATGLLYIAIVTALAGQFMLNLLVTSI
ncbi:MAG: hypothetical protein ABR507_10155 [Actinomycetota bacterium]|nr:hypothetical protein [Actinomycetota bacterium]